MIDKLKEILKFKDQDNFKEIDIFEIKEIFKYFHSIYSWYTNNKINDLIEKEKIKLLKFDDKLLNLFNTFISKELLFISKKYTTLYYKANVTSIISNYTFQSIKHDSFYDKDIKLQHLNLLYDNTYLNIQTKQRLILNDSSYTGLSSYDSEKEVLNISIKDKETIDKLFDIFNYNDIIDNIFSINRAINSCGIISVDGVNGINFRKIKSCKKNQDCFLYYLKINENTIYLEFDTIDLFINFLSIHIKKLIRYVFPKSSMIVFSTNIDNNRYFDEINMLLDIFKKFELHTLETFNNNSNNNIVTKIYDHRKFIQ